MGCSNQYTGHDTMDTVNNLLTDYKASLGKARLNDFEKERLLNNLQEVLSLYCAHFGDNIEIRYHIRKRIIRLELIISIKGEKWNPFEEEKDENLTLLQKINSLSMDGTSQMSYRYIRGYNIIALRSSVYEGRSNLLKQPIIWSIILGIICGWICKGLPQPASSFIVDDIAVPVLNIILKLMSGIMGPVIFLSLVTAINTLDSINELNQMGFKVVRRFIRSAVFCTVVAGLAGILLFGGLAEGTADFEPSMIIDMLLSVIPTSLVTPFVENNIPQLVVLGVALGAVLLLLGERLHVLTDILQNVKEWINELVNIVLKAIIIIPFLTILKIIARGESAQLLEGWKFIVGVYGCFILCLVVKLLKVSIRCKVSIIILLRKLMPLAGKAFVAGSSYAAIGSYYETSKEKLGIKEGFSSFWIPMSHAMLWPCSPIKYTIAAIFAATLAGVPVSVSFLLVLIIIVVELALASPGFAAGCSIIFPALGISVEYVGIFTAYNVFVRNAGAAFDTSYQMLEQIEVAKVMKKIEVNTLSTP